jgi:hypothetical protein
MLDEDGCHELQHDIDRVEAAFDQLKLCLLRLGWTEVEWINLVEGGHFEGVSLFDDGLCFAAIPPHLLPGREQKQSH